MPWLGSDLSEPEGGTTRICQCNVSSCVCVAALERDVPIIAPRLPLGPLEMTMTNTKWSSVWTRFKDLNVGIPQSSQLLVIPKACTPTADSENLDLGMSSNVPPARVILALPIRLDNPLAVGFSLP